jgi:hypothetical protein
VVPAFITSCSTEKRAKVVLPVMLDAAPDGPWVMSLPTGLPPAGSAWQRTAWR